MIALEYIEIKDRMFLGYNCSNGVKTRAMLWVRRGVNQTGRDEWQQWRGISEWVRPPIGGSKHTKTILIPNTKCSHMEVGKVLHHLKKKTWPFCARNYVYHTPRGYRFKKENKYCLLRPLVCRLSSSVFRYVQPTFFFRSIFGDA